MKKKTTMRNILNQNENMEKNKYKENPEPKREYEKQVWKILLTKKRKSQKDT